MCHLSFGHPPCEGAALPSEVYINVTPPDTDLGQQQHHRNARRTWPLVHLLRMVFPPGHACQRAMRQLPTPHVGRWACIRRWRLVKDQTRAAGMGRTKLARCAWWNRRKRHEITESVTAAFRVTDAIGCIQRVGVVVCRGAVYFNACMPDARQI